ncbi:Uncharacterized protein Fot_14593 [Forsythia ovata]|uniref:Uncharacterized protein n=1 Tax=Forsythia ovata TaxID=205694 RepID=A0ABD1WAB3_9LAMI
MNEAINNIDSNNNENVESNDKIDDFARMMMRSRSVGVGTKMTSSFGRDGVSSAASVKRKSWYFPSPMKVFWSTRTPKVINNDRSPLHRDGESVLLQSRSFFRDCSTRRLYVGALANAQYWILSNTVPFLAGDKGGRGLRARRLEAQARLGMSQARLGMRTEVHVMWPPSGGNGTAGKSHHLQDLKPVYLALAVDLTEHSQPLMMRKSSNLCNLNRINSLGLSGV